MSVFCDVSDWIFHTVLSFNYQMKIKLFFKNLLFLLNLFFYLLSVQMQISCHISNCFLELSVYLFLFCFSDITE